MRATAVIPVLGAALAGTAILTSSAAIAGSGQETVAVSGSGADIASEAIVHSEETTPTGMVRTLTEIVELTGDLHGKVLYQARQEFDFVANTLVVTGANVFSGTIAGSDPVILRSDESRFEVDLATGEETGKVHLTRSNDAPDNGSWYECDLVVVGTGQSPEGNPTFDYSGTCTHRGR
ncbi:MAG: hypothetical protein M3364_02040 [Actinomycetota bacterium]|nr:hypothetical protein [Actinomycetota bacterium]